MRRSYQNGISAGVASGSYRPWPDLAGRHGPRGLFQGLLEGQSGLGQVTRFDPSEYTCQIAAQVADDFNAKVISMQIPFFFLSFLKASRSYDMVLVLN